MYLFVLHRPASPENLGMVARALKNAGLGRLVLVDPPHHRFAEARKTAVRAEDLLDTMRVEKSFEDAVAGTVLVVGTTARELEGREVLEPREAAELLVRESARGPVALCFGEEKRGLPNVLLARCDAVATIPADPAQPSLNLAQAATVFAYELRRAVFGAKAVARKRPTTRAIARAPSRPATREDLDRLRAAARSALLEAGYLNPRQPDRVLDELCRAIGRARPTAREVGLFIGALKQLARLATMSRAK